MHEHAVLTEPTVMGLLWLLIGALSLYLSAARTDADMLRITGISASAAFLLTVNGVPALWQFLSFYVILCTVRAVRAFEGSRRKRRFRALFRRS